MKIEWILCGVPESWLHKKFCEEMRELLVAKANVDRLRSITDKIP